MPYWLDSTELNGWDQQSQTLGGTVGRCSHDVHTLPIRAAEPLLFVNCQCAQTLDSIGFTHVSLQIFGRHFTLCICMYLQTYRVDCLFFVHFVVPMLRDFSATLHMTCFFSEEWLLHALLGKHVLVF